MPLPPGYVLDQPAEPQERKASPPAGYVPDRPPAVERTDLFPRVSQFFSATDPGPAPRAEEFKPPRLLESLWESTVGAIPAAVSEFYQRPGERDKAAKAMRAYLQAQAEGRPMTPEEQRHFNVGSAAQIVSPTPPMVPEGTEPAIASAEMARTGDYQGAAGTLAGSYGVPAAIAAIGPARVKPPLRNPNPVKAAAVDYALEQGMPVSAGVATGNKFVAGVEKLSEHTPLGALVGERGRQRGAEALARRGQALAGEAHPAPQVPETAGLAVRGDIDRTIARLKREADDSYAPFHEAANDPRNMVEVRVPTRPGKGGHGHGAAPAAEPAPSNIREYAAWRERQAEVQAPAQKIAMPVDVSEIKQQLAPVFDDLQWMPAAERSAHAGYTAIKRILEGPDVIPAVQAERGLSGIKTMARGAESADLRNMGQGIAAGIVGGLQEKIDAAARRAGVYRELSKGRIAHAEKMDAAGILQTLRAEPVQVFDQAVWKNDAGIERLRNVAGAAPDQMPKIGRAWLEKNLGEATAEGAFQKTGTLWSRWQDLGDETKKILFPDAGLRGNLDKFFQYAKQFGDNPNPSGTAFVSSISGQMVLLVAHPVTGATAMIGGGALAKLLYNPTFVKAMVQGFNIGDKSRAAAILAAPRLLQIAGNDAKPVESSQPNKLKRPPLTQFEGRQ